MVILGEIWWDSVEFGGKGRKWANRYASITNASHVMYASLRGSDRGDTGAHSGNNVQMKMDFLGQILGWLGLYWSYLCFDDISLHKGRYDRN
jgi:hypothetical protein